MKIIKWFKDHWISILLWLAIIVIIATYFYLGDKYDPDFWKATNITNGNLNTIVSW